jgi:hypothetical protein
MQTFVHHIERRQKECDKKARLRAKRKAIRENSDEPIRQEWRGIHAFTISVHDRLTGKLNCLDFYISQKRINSYRVTVNGEPWKEQVSMSKALAGLRKGMPKFAIHA